jgi:murein DD-endopeptidase MepM/ murein hydrolase activator NlpD
VLSVHDGEPDHEARRSQLALLPYALTQGARARSGHAGLAGNHVVIELDGRAGCVVLAHLRAGSVAVAAGEPVATGQVLGACGNSGNSTQPHLHIQVMDSPDAATARGLPLSFRRYRARDRRGGEPVVVEQGVPNESEVVEAL